MTTPTTTVPPPQKRRFGDRGLGDVIVLVAVIALVAVAYLLTRDGDTEPAPADAVPSQPAGTPYTMHVTLVLAPGVGEISEACEATSVDPDYADLTEATPVRVLDPSGAVVGTTQLGRGVVNPLIVVGARPGRIQTAPEGLACNFNFQMAVPRGLGGYRILIGDRDLGAFAEDMIAEARFPHTRLMVALR